MSAMSGTANSAAFDGVRRPQVGDKVGYCHIRLVPDGGNHRNFRLEDRPGHTLVVEGPQILDGPAAAPRDDKVGDTMLVGVPDRADDLWRRFHPLDAHRQHDDFRQRPALSKYSDHIADGGARGGG